MRFIFHAASCRLATLALAAPSLAGAQVLYDAGQDELPQAQGWFYLALPSAPAPLVAVTNGVLFLDSMATNSIQAGYALTTPTDLNRTDGFAVNFSLRLTAEQHSGSEHRAGFSVIVLDAEARGIELGFWTTSIWAQADAPIFTRAEQVSVDTTAAWLDCTLSLGPTNYTLFVDSHPLLVGPVRDYSAFAGVLDPYETPNFLFFGDNTTSARAAWGLKHFTLVTPPELTAAGSGVLAWSSASNLTFTVEASTNLTTWIRLASVFSPTTAYRFTNAVPLPEGFLRVRFP
jgi:hypothetical protein